MQWKTTALMSLALAAMLLGGPVHTARAEDTAVPQDGSAKPGFLKGLTFTLDYTLVSDYVFRGINLSEYAGEGREKLNHQWSVGFEVDAGAYGVPIGRFGGNVWFEYYAAQQKLTPWGGSNLQEVDYTVYWSYDVAETGLTVDVGWIAYHLPRLRSKHSPGSSDAAYTQDVYLSLAYDDSKLFGTKSGVLNPAVTWYMDVDDLRASWITVGVSHGFAMADCPTIGGLPILKDMTVTPSLTLGIDHRYYDKVGVGSAHGVATRLGNLEYGLDVGLDLSSILGIPKRFGSLGLTGFLKFSQAFHDDNAAVNDELYGGFSVGYSW